MLSGIGIGITGIAIVLLAIYGADVAAIQASGADEQGFLPFDAKTRGMVLGAPGLILPFIAFGIAWKSPTPVLGIMIIIAGLLILAGGAFILGAGAETQEESERPVAMESAMLIGAGAIQMALGAVVIYRSRGK